MAAKPVHLAQHGSGKTLRRLIRDRAGCGLGGVVGTPDQVAERLEEVMDEVEGDGFLLSTPLQKVSRQCIVEITEGLVPAMRRRGLARTAYARLTLREMLTDF